jgi:cold shock CspA family protein
MRVGEVVKLVYDRKFGFIRAANFRNDIFFHFSTVVGSRPDLWDVGQEVEFELKEVRRLELGELEAEIVQAASRPLTHKLDEYQKPGMTPIHHPKAKRKKPGWRQRNQGSENAE